MTNSQLFDRTFRLKHAPISMTQFVFTAGTIHLLAAANSKSVESDTALVKRCIVVLQSMGQTWKCASQSSDALQRLLKEWHLKLASSNENRATSVGSNALEKATEEPPSATTPQPIDMQTMLQQNPDVVQQLQQLGWAPPRLDSVSNPSSGFSQDLETLLAGPGYTVSTTYQSNCSLIKKYPYAELILVCLEWGNRRSCDCSTARCTRHKHQRYVMEHAAFWIYRSFLHLNTTSSPRTVTI